MRLPMTGKLWLVTFPLKAPWNESGLHVMEAQFGLTFMKKQIVGRILKLLTLSSHCYRQILHPLVARHCLELKKHFLNASYVSDEMNALHSDALANNLLFLNECGLDPGIDHMSAMQVIDKIKNGGGILTSFESFTGGLIAPDTDPENPWRYKFTWNPA